MSHSTTTATSRYVLTRYSKSYPTNRHPSENQIEWQHFTNPTINLVLDRQKSTGLDSVRLRILWSIDRNNANSNDVVFEDIDLLTFSRLPTRMANRQSPESLPLKAVYRDTLVGIRYLHLADSNEEPVYRRFQITFQSDTAASEFIDLIRPVCPCKANPHPASTSKNLQAIGTLGNAPSAMPLHIAREEYGSKAGPPQTLNRRSDAPLSSIQRDFSSQKHMHTPPDISTSNSNSNSSALATATQAMSMPPPPVARSEYTLDPVSRSDARNHFSEPASQQLLTNNHFQQLPLNDMMHTPSFMTSSAQSAFYGAHSGRSFTQSSQQLASADHLSLQTNAIPVRCAPQQSFSMEISSNTRDPAAPFLASLRDVADLYDLPQPALEKVIAQVVREEGFVKLVRACI